MKNEIDRLIAITQFWHLCTYSWLEVIAQILGGRQSSCSSWARNPDNLHRHVREHYQVCEQGDLIQTEVLPGEAAFKNAWH